MTIPKVYQIVGKDGSRFNPVYLTKAEARMRYHPSMGDPKRTFVDELIICDSPTHEVIICRRSKTRSSLSKGAAIEREWMIAELNALLRLYGKDLVLQLLLDKIKGRNSLAFRAEGK